MEWFPIVSFCVVLVVCTCNIVTWFQAKALQEDRDHWKVAAKKSEAREDELRLTCRELKANNVELTRELALKEDQKRRTEQVLREYFNLKLEG